MRGHRVPLLVLAALLLLPPARPVGAAPAQLPVSTGFVAAGGADFAAMRRAGARSLKLLADWSFIEADRGEFDWEATDRAVSAAAKAGLSITLILAYTPKWASLATGVELQDASIWSRQPPKRVADWETFVAAAAGRYKGRVREWQVWTVLSLPVWRGTAREYFTLVRAVRAKTAAVDPGNRVVLATPYGMDLISIRRAVREISASFDAVSLAPRGLAPEALLRPLGVLRERILSKTPKALRIEWDPRAFGDRTGWSAQMVKVTAIAAAFKLDRVEWVIDPAIGGTALEVLSTRIGNGAFEGYLSEARSLAFVFGGPTPAAVAWSVAGETSLAFEGEGVTAVNPAGQPRSVDTQGGRTFVTVGPEPLLVQGFSASVSAAARENLQARGLPLPPSGRDFSQAADVRARLGKSNVEDGLYNMPFRDRRSGAVEAVEVAGSEAVRTNTSKDIVFIYFDVDDSFMYYVDGRYGVEVEVEVRGASAPGQLGFNLFYDSMTDLRFSPWQVVDAKDGWVTYTFRLPDAAFANTWGWDFAINAGGNRNENLTVRSVTVRKK